MTNQTTQTGTALKRLRTLLPQRDCIFAETLQIAERQATRLAEMFDGDGIQIHHIAHMPRTRVVYDDLPVSGMSHWNGREWVITINYEDALARQRFTVLHELKHIIDHGHTTRLYTGTKRHGSYEQAELAADYFAGCALVSKRDLKSAWGNGVQNPIDLATHFAVSPAAIRTRLAQTGLDVIADHVPTARCARPVRTPRQHTQQFRYAHNGLGRRNNV